MTIQEAIAFTKRIGEWSIVLHEPTSIDIEYEEIDGTTAQVTFNLYNDDPEEELTTLWGTFYKELRTKPDSVKALYVYGYIVE